MQWGYTMYGKAMPYLNKVGAAAAPRGGRPGWPSTFAAVSAAGHLRHAGRLPLPLVLPNRP